jgi:hypothetical protein
MRNLIQDQRKIEQSYWMRGYKLDPQPLDESPTPKSNKSRLDLHDSILAGKSIGSNQKKKRRAHDLKEPRCKLGSNTRIQFDPNESEFGLWTPSKVGLSIEV